MTKKETELLPGENWHTCLKAALRKVELAQYHFRKLCKSLDECRKPFDEFPPLSVQAHFEGVLFSIDAAFDQTKKAISIVLDVKQQEALKELARLVPELSAVRDWFYDPLFSDLRTVRNHITHASYSKSFGRVVKPEGSRYTGCRELRKYCEAAVRQAVERSSLITKIEEELDRMCTSSSASGRRTTPNGHNYRHRGRLR
jgi:hypothetical protein